MSQALNLFDDFPEQPKRGKENVLLSHYTDLPGLLSILTNNELWASNILFLNDRREMRYGLDAAKAVLKEVMEATDPKRESKALTALDKNVPEVFACCFCEEPDMLSQWRGYGAGRQNVSIQFGMIGLLHVALANSGNLQGVVYGRKEAMDHIRTRFARVASGMPTGLEALRFETDEMRRKAVYEIAPQIKDPSFKEEREWRIILSGEYGREVCFRAKDNIVMPYVKLKPMQGQRLPIRRITVGPGKEAELTRTSIEHFLRRNNDYEGVEVAVSDIPFRT